MTGIRAGVGLAAAIAGRAAAGGTGGGLVAASVETDPFDAVTLFAAAESAGMEAALMLRPDEGFELVGIGRAWSFDGSGPARFRDADTATRLILETALVSRPAEVRGLGPVLLGGMGFSGRIPDAADGWAPFGAASLVLPSLVALRSAGRCWLTGSVLRDDGEAGAAGVATRLPAEAERLEALWTRVSGLAESRPIPAASSPADAPLAIDRELPTPDQWRRVVGLMAGAVGRGRLDKVVFARLVDLISPVALDVAPALRRMAASAPESAIFAFRRVDAAFIGATPERLVRSEGRTYRTAAVAGSTRRGSDDVEDAALAAELLASEKEREEHAVVVRAIRRDLAPLSARIDVAPQPGIMTLRHVQHLVTEITGTLRDQTGLLALADLLHPTPAVGGEPPDLALAMIDEHEGFDRGWYAGPIGWLGAGGDGELMVALRSGLVRGNRATLFAGCGIVADSDPDREWEESRIKMRAVATALGSAGEAL